MRVHLRLPAPFLGGFVAAAYFEAQGEVINTWKILVVRPTGLLKVSLITSGVASTFASIFKLPGVSR